MAKHVLEVKLLLGCDTTHFTFNWSEQITRQYLSTGGWMNAVLLCAQSKRIGIWEQL